MKIPIPKDWQEFESQVREAMILRWNSPNLQKNGRTGQAQQGVDVWGSVKSPKQGARNLAECAECCDQGSVR
jgi:hypothetical protein